MPESRIDESAARVVQLKKTLGLLSQPVPPLSHPYLHTVGAAEDRAAALDIAREAVVLLKNEPPPAEDEGG